MKYLLSLDLGVTTGFAVLNAEGEIRITGDVDHAEFTAWLHDQIAHGVPCAWSCAERPVSAGPQFGVVGLQCASVIAATNMLLARQVDWVMPADWKQTPFSKSKVPRGLSQHVRDAVRMGRWYLETVVHA